MTHSRRSRHRTAPASDMRDASDLTDSASAQETAFQAIKALADAGFSANDQQVLCLAEQNVNLIRAAMMADPRMTVLLEPMLDRAQKQGQDLIVTLATERGLLPQTSPTTPLPSTGTSDDEPQMEIERIKK